MNLSEISNRRLHSQQLVKKDYSLPKQLVEWMGAIQAQDLPMALLAIALRTENATVKTIEKALNDGEIIRTHLMRPTWHIVSKEDIYWMLDLTAPALLRMSATRNKQLELTDEMLKKSLRLLEKNLQGKELSRQDITRIFNEHNLRTDENRLSHFLMNAEYEQLICSGSLKGRLQTYALLEEKVPMKKRFSREEAILKLTEVYFRSHAPATIKDFAWWSFLPLKEIRWALEELKYIFQSEKIGEDTYYFPADISEIKHEKTAALLLPAYDEFLISYQSKHVSVVDLHIRKAVSVNGIFCPVIVENGQVTGTWKKTSSKKNIEIETEFFEEEKDEFHRFNEKIKSIVEFITV